MTSLHRFHVWSASPTPFHEDLTPDEESIIRLVHRHRDLGVAGTMFGGTCGEGPWMPMEDLETIVRIAKQASGGKLQIAAQVTDNSARRVLRHIDRMAEAGADYAVMASPYFLIHTDPSKILHLHQEIIRSSVLPMGFYDRGLRAGYPVAIEGLPQLLEEPNLKLVKDSSGDQDRRKVYLSIRKQRTDLQIFSGDEFRCAEPLQAGYQGLLLGGGIFNTLLARRLCTAVEGGDLANAEAIQQRMNTLMFRVYGGPKITCWLAGLKYLLVTLDVFSSTAHYLGYPLTEECKAAIDEIVKGPDKDSYRPDLVPSSHPIP